MNRRDFLTLSAAALTPGTALAQSNAYDLSDFFAQQIDGAFLIRDLYNRDRSFSDLALASEGYRVLFTGFMAPPLRADANFFVLTKQPMSVCPFCEPGAEWPTDILPVYTKRVVRPTPFNVRIKAEGILEIGEFIDPESGFYSLVRLTDATFEE